MPPNDIVFEGDEVVPAIRGGAMSPVASSPIVDFLISKGFLHSERKARLFVTCVAIVALVTTGWISRGALSEPTGRAYASLAPTEKAALPKKQRARLEQIEIESNDRIINTPSANRFKI